jgi:thioredoxin-like negative regulator of GroEL
VLIGYFLTMAPELTLEDSGELATGSFYAGIPHPPGYPVWTVYTWFWTLLPFKNIAWRVALGEAVGGALAAGLLALLVSRGSSLLMEGIEELKAMSGKWENAICIIAGFVAGMLIGFNGFMWSQSVIVEVYAFSVASFMVVLLCILRWIYAPRQYRYLFIALFMHGVCFTNHQTLIVAAMGIEVAIAAAHFRLGRQLFLGNSVIYICGLILKQGHVLTALEQNPAILSIFHSIGVGSILASALLIYLTREKFGELAYASCEAAMLLCLAGALGFAGDPKFNDLRFLFKLLGGATLLAMMVCGFTVLSRIRAKELFRDLAEAGLFIFLAAYIALGSPSGGAGSWKPFCAVLALASFGGFAYLAWETRKLGLEWLVVLGLGLCWIAGAMFYFYMPLAGMTNPPMEWGYPRTVEGFIHAFTRGQYEKTNPSNVLGDPLHFLGQLHRLWDGIIEEFNWVYIFLALVPFAFFLKMHRRERAWLIGITAIYFFLGILLMILLNPPPDKQAQQLVRVFFTASHVCIALLVGYGLTLVAAYMATHFATFRRWGAWGGAAGVALALLSLAEASETFIPHGVEITGIEHLFGALAAAVMLGMIAALTVSMILGSHEAERIRIADLTGLFVGAGSFVLIELLLRIFRSQIGSFQGAGALLAAIGRAFAKDQYGLPIFAGLMLVGMTVIFLGSLFAYRDRAPLGITLAVFAIMPLHSIMTHWADNEQAGHWFGYWFGHDMFTPPFKGKDGKPLYPEMTKDAVLFGGTDPGRFCPTYMIFCDSFIPGKCQPLEDQSFDRRDVYIITQNALADGTYLCYIRAQYNRSTQKDPPFFQEFFRDILRDSDLKTNFLARAAQPLDTFFTNLGDRIEKRRRTFTSWFEPDHFKNLSSFAGKLKAQQDPLSKYVYENLGPETQKALAAGDEKALRSKLAEDLNRLIDRELEARKSKDEKQQEKDSLSDRDRTGERGQKLDREIAELSKVEPFYNADRFKGVQIPEYLQAFIKESPQSHTRVRLNRLLLEAAYPEDIVKTKGGVYPDREIYTPTLEDSQVCFSEYLQDANRRLMHDQQFPNEPKQIRVGEDVRVDGGKVSVSGQVAVMTINGLLTKVIFDHNPKNEFFVEESFPLDWMYPYLTPFGVIMKINRNQLPEISEDICSRDHEFWKQFSERLTGDFIEYDTPIQKITDWVEKTYLRRDFSGFTGDRRFVRDDQGQKAFSKLRSSIGGVYAWRLTSDPGSKTPVLQQRMASEAEFAFKQAFAFCPYSPEAVFRYVNLLLGQRRFEEALLIGETCLKLDPYNGQVIDLVNRLRMFRKEAGALGDLPKLERAARDNPTDVQAAFTLASAYMQFQQTNQAIAALEPVLKQPNVDARAARAIARAFLDLGYTNGVRQAVSKMEEIVKASPTNNEARLALAETHRLIGESGQALTALQPVLDDPRADASMLRFAAAEYSQIPDFGRLETALERLSVATPDSMETWYDLSGVRAHLGRTRPALDALKQAVELNAARRKTNTAVPDLGTAARQDPKFASLWKDPEFIQLTTPK